MSALVKNVIVTSLIFAFSWTCFISASYSQDMFDVVSGIIESPKFKGSDPFNKLKSASVLIKNRQLKHSDASYMLLDWTDQYIRELSQPLDRLKRWTDLSTDEDLKHLRIPRDYLNRVFLTEYLVSLPGYEMSNPQERLEILGRLSEQNLIDWSVGLAFARLYAGSLVLGVQAFNPVPPMKALANLKKIKDNGLVGWHYGVPTEALLCSEALAADSSFRSGAPIDQLIKLRDLEREGLISQLTKKEFEKLPVWRFLIADPGFLKADSQTKREKIVKMKTDGLVSVPTCAELNGIFKPAPYTAPSEPQTIPVPQKILPLGN